MQLILGTNGVDQLKPVSEAVFQRCMDTANIWASETLATAEVKSWWRKSLLPSLLHITPPPYDLTSAQSTFDQCFRGSMELVGWRHANITAVPTDVELVDWTGRYYEEKRNVVESAWSSIALQLVASSVLQTRPGMPWKEMALAVFTFWLLFESLTTLTAL